MKLSLKSIDTITTKLLTLVLFITVIPLMAIANFSTGIINQSMLDSSKNELDFNVKLSSEKYQDELEQLKLSTIQSIKGYIEDSYFNYLKSGELNDLKSNLSTFQKSSALSFCYVVDKNGNVISGNNAITLPDRHLLKISKIALSGDTILSSEIISNENSGSVKWIKNSNSYLAQVVAIPIVLGKSVPAVVLAGKNLTNNSNVPVLVKKITGANLNIYKILNNHSSIVTTNTGQNVQEIPNEILSQIKSGNSISVRADLNGTQIGLYDPIKNYFGKIVGVMYIGIEEAKFVEPVNKNIKLIGIIAVISLIVAIALAALFARTITTPILKLVSAAKFIATGDLNQRVKIKGNDETAQLSDTFNQMADNLQKQEQLKDNFVATLTHDLKVPMLAENQTINYLLKQSYGPVTQEQKEVLDLIKSTNNSSLEMVSTLLEVYRYSTGNVQLMKSEFNIVQLLNESIEQINSLAIDKKITISLETDRNEVNVYADEREIKRVLHNLISNAINNGIQRGHIICKIDSVKDKKVYAPKADLDSYSTFSKPIDISNSVLISIKDDGIGMSKEDIPQLFKRFSLNKGRKPAGTGLGLYYSYQVITQHGGFIWAESTEGNGSTFTFKLPLK